MKVGLAKQHPTIFPIQKKLLFQIHKDNNPVFFQFLQKNFLENYLGRWEQQVRETPGEKVTFYSANKLYWVGK